MTQVSRTHNQTDVRPAAPDRLVVEMIRQALRIDCPVCERHAYSVCISPTLRPIKPHIARVEALLGTEVVS